MKEDPNKMSAGNLIVKQIIKGKKAGRVFAKAVQLEYFEKVAEMKNEISEAIFKSQDQLDVWNDGNETKNYDLIESHASGESDEDLKLTRNGEVCELSKEDSEKVVSFLESVSPKLKEKAIERMQENVATLSALISKIIK